MLKKKTIGEVLRTCFRAFPILGPLIGVKLRIKKSMIPLWCCLALQSAANTSCGLYIAPILLMLCCLYRLAYFSRTSLLEICSVPLSCKMTTNYIQKYCPAPSGPRPIPNERHFFTHLCFHGTLRSD